MWIRSQDKRGLYNVNSFFMRKISDSKYIISCDLGGGSIAEYSSEERALFILRVIQERINNRNKKVFDLPNDMNLHYVGGKQEYYIGNDDCKLSDRRILRELKDKGYFKCADYDTKVSDILANCEVIQ